MPVSMLFEVHKAHPVLCSRFEVRSFGLYMRKPFLGNYTNKVAL
jgi:hypothetical protein